MQKENLTYRKQRKRVLKAWEGMTLALVEVERSLNGATEKFSMGRYVFTFPHCGIKSTEYLWTKTKRLVKDERLSKRKLLVCA